MGGSPGICRSVGRVPGNCSTPGAVVEPGVPGTVAGNSVVCVGASVVVVPGVVAAGGVVGAIFSTSAASFARHTSSSLRRSASRTPPERSAAPSSRFFAASASPAAISRSASCSCDVVSICATVELRPIANVPRHPLRLASFGPRALLPAAVTARWWRTDKARALFGGAAAHAYYRLDRPATSAVGMMIVAAGHRYGWPVAEGGSQSITGALAALLTDRGGKITTGVHVRDWNELPPADVVLLDVAPSAALGILGARLPDRVARAYRRFKHAPAAFKVDFAIQGGVPWADPECGRAGTVHLGGSFAEIAAAERDVAAGRMPGRPFVLLGQQYLADRSRSNGDLHPLYAYAHVPHGYTGDATEAITAQIERFAPGFRDRIVATVSSGPARLAASNPNYVGGDIIGGANTETQVVLRPRIALDPYSTGIPGTYLCSASTPPGAGAHGMCGYNAAQSALRYLRKGGGDVQ
ncbi:phytoene desaturase family protein [Rhodococcus opacus]|uniref:phytoene desaturase family protein n=1 Tax=Rhodococcus opacus TaxID=37919 RepID=UPI003D133D5E